MTKGSAAAGKGVGSITVRYWAAARAAAGVDSDTIAAQDGTTLADVLDAVRALHQDRPRLSEVVRVCSVLVGDRPVGSADPVDVHLRAGDIVELLPPFAGGSAPLVSERAVSQQPKPASGRSVTSQGDRPGAFQFFW